MKPTTCSLLIPILLLLMSPGRTEQSLDSIVDERIKEALQGLDCNPHAPASISCTSVTNSGKLSSCPAGTSVTGCACGYGCGSWDIRRETTCHCQCSVVDWTTARCCRLV
ncbi:resistin-like beta [Pipistrellus kuhlii]|uniref:Resistin like beta n=1 Tax=Pipistrellus kuhlii TaxID=59472 RepID=A0A7J8AB20_PIPKU|nr:resistin-like beta [Pipistrellus kuhlii]KAF6383425.1 resistin like beta [Pipistrellus kuhlii]